MRIPVVRLLPLLLVAGGIGLAAVLRAPAAADQQVAAAPIDYDALRRQAVEALERLQRPREDQLAASGQSAL